MFIHTDSREKPIFPKDSSRASWSRVLRTIEKNTGNANTAGSPPPPTQQAVPVQHAIEMPVMQATQQPPRGARFDPQTGQPIPKFDPITGVQNWFD